LEWLQDVGCGGHTRAKEAAEKVSAAKKSGAESRGIPHLAKNERDVGHPGSFLRRMKACNCGYWGGVCLDPRIVLRFGLISACAPAGRETLGAAST
jgi:hypothetical protein